MRSVGERVTFCRRLFRELFEVVHFKGEMGEIGADHYRPAFVKFANLDFLVATGRFQKNQLRATARGLAPNLIEPKNILTMGYRNEHRYRFKLPFWTKQLKRLHCAFADSHRAEARC